MRLIEGFPVIILSIQDHGNVAFVSRCDDDVLVINPLNASSSAVVMFLEGQRALFRIPAIATLADSACKISFCLRKTGSMLEIMSFLGMCFGAGAKFKPFSKIELSATAKL